MEERRREIRKRSLKSGLIVFNEGFSTFNCTIKNISENGAKLVLRHMVDLPDHFGLRLEDGLHHDCTVQWRKYLEMGVRFGDLKRTESLAAGTESPGL